MPSNATPTAAHLRLPAVLLALLCAGPARAQQVADLAGEVESARPILQARGRTDEIRVDGVIDESAWSAADVATGFVQSEPDERAKATQETEVRVLLDDDAIYFAARMWDSHPDSIVRRLVRRDERGGFFDWFGVSIDPNHDRRTAYFFDVSAAGVQQDRYVFDDQFEDGTWNAVGESAVSLDSLGWSAEFRIPLSEIRYAPAPAPGGCSSHAGVSARAR